MQKILERYPNQLPKKEINSYDLGVLVGQQEVVDFILSLTKLDVEEKELKEK